MPELPAITLYGDLSQLVLSTADGGPATLPQLTLGDTPRFRLRTLDVVSGNLRERPLNVRTLKAQIGNVMAAPTTGTFSLTFNGPGGSADSSAIDFGATTAAFTAASAAALATATLTLASIELAAPSTWLLKITGMSGDYAAVTLAANALAPESRVRIRAFEQSGTWFHEIRLIQQPLAFNAGFTRVLGEEPRVREVREGNPGTTVQPPVNEIQAIRIPPDFRGTFILHWNYRETRVLGIQDGPQLLEEAFNNMFTDGAKRFAVTVPEDDHAYVEFIGDLAGEAQDLFTVEVNTFEPGVLTFELPLNMAAMGTALRAKTTIDEPFEITLTVIPDGEDLETYDGPVETLTFKKETVTINREAIDDELAAVSDIDWERPTSPVDYIPFTPDEVLTGQQTAFPATIGNGVLTSFTIDHDQHSAIVQVEIVEIATKRVLRDNEYVVHLDSDDSTIISGFASTPTLNQYAVLISAIGPASVFQAHTHTIAQVVGLQAALDALGGRMTAVEALAPRIQFGSASSTGAPAITFALPAFMDLFPRQSGTPIDLGNLPRAGGLLPAVHDATVTSYTSGALPDLTTFGGNVYQNNSSAALLLPGGLSTRGSYVAIGAYFGGDGRRWYPVTRAGSTNSYYPRDFERELWMFEVDAQMLRAGTTLTVNFALATQLLQAVSRAQAFLVIEHGTASMQSAPVGTAVNLTDNGTGTHSLIRDGVTLGTFTAVFGTDIMTITGTVPANDDVVRVTNSGGALPAPLAAGTDYVVRDLSGSTFKLALLTTAPNLSAVVWNATPLLTQRIILGETKVPRTFGAAITRAANGVISANKIINGFTAVAEATPTQADLVYRGLTFRARVINFDTDNSITTAKGNVLLDMTEGTVVIA